MLPGLVVLRTMRGLELSVRMLQMMNFTLCTTWMTLSSSLTLLWGQTFQRASGSVSLWMRMVNGSQDPVCNRLKLSSVRGIKVSTFRNLVFENIFFAIFSNGFQFSSRRGRKLGCETYQQCCQTQKRAPYHDRFYTCKQQLLIQK